MKCYELVEVASSSTTTAWRFTCSLEQIDKSTNEGEIQEVDDENCNSSGSQPDGPNQWHHSWESYFLLLHQILLMYTLILIHALPSDWDEKIPYFLGGTTDISEICATDLGKVLHSAQVIACLKFGHKQATRYL